MEKVEENLIIIRDPDEVDALIEYLADKDVIAFDTETTGIGKDAEIIGASVCAEPGVAFYVITAYWDVEAKELKYLPTKEKMPDFARALIGKRLVMHNGLFDCDKVETNYVVRLIDDLYADTMIMAHLIDENRLLGLKELAKAVYGTDATKEQDEMKASVTRNGGVLTKKLYELYKADADLIAKYGAKDTILTYNLFMHFLPLLEEEGMVDFFFNESMPLLRGPTYTMNTIGLKVDGERLAKLKRDLEIEILQLNEFICKEIATHTQAKYPKGFGKKKTEFNIGSGAQLAWLLFDQLGNVFPKVSNAGQDLARALEMKTPYSNADKRRFTELVIENKGQVWREAGWWNAKTKKKTKTAAKVGDYWTYLSTDKTVLAIFAEKYKWVEALVKYKKLTKMLSTYVIGIQDRTRYGIINPSFLQHGTTSGRYSSRAPNFQNLPRDDKRVKACIVARPGKVFVGADYSQLEPRVFASYSQDPRLMGCFESGEDFYSVVGAPVFASKVNMQNITLIKDDNDPNFFGNKYKKYRQIAKTIALSATYGTTANKMADAIKIAAKVAMERDEAQAVIDDYFDAYPSVKGMMAQFHRQVKKQGYVQSMFGRKRRIPEAKSIGRIYGEKVPHHELPYAARNLLNLAVNHPIQSTGASIVNRAAIKFHEYAIELERQKNPEATLPSAYVVSQVHDEIIVECDEADAEIIVELLKDAMENTNTLPGVALLAEPKIGHDMAELK